MRLCKSPNIQTYLRLSLLSLSKVAMEKQQPEKSPMHFLVLGQVDFLAGQGSHPITKSLT